MQTDYYTLLEVNRSASPVEIRRAFRRKILEHHPDRNYGDPYAAELTIRIYEAYTTLVNPKTRATYDSALDRNDVSSSQSARGAFRSDPWRPRASRTAKRVTPIPPKGPPEPEVIRCKRCKRCDDTLRHSEFFMVIGMVSFTKHSVEQPGVYCSVCRGLIGAKWLMLSTMCGIWSPAGIVWAVRAAVRNAGGGLRRGHHQRALLVQLASRLIWQNQFRDARRVVYRLNKIDPKNPNVPAMVEKVRANPTHLSLNPLYYLRRMPAAFVCLPIAVAPLASVLGIGSVAAGIQGSRPAKFSPQRGSIPLATGPDGSSESFDSQLLPTMPVRTGLRLLSIRHRTGPVESKRDNPVSKGESDISAPHGSDVFSQGGISWPSRRNLTSPAIPFHLLPPPAPAPTKTILTAGSSHAQTADVGQLSRQ